MSDKDIRLSRRKVLAGLGTIGIASAGAGLGTTAWLSDEESFLNNVLTAGTLDLSVEWYVEYNGAETNIWGPNTRNGASGGGSLDDVKPGDSGLARFCFQLDDNPGYLWTCSTVDEDSENGANEPERLAEPDWETDPDGELDDLIEATLSYCLPDGEGGYGAGAQIASGSLRDVLDAMENGVPLDGDARPGVLEPGTQAPYPGSDDGMAGPCLCLEWELPTSVGNEVQSDRVQFDLDFHVVQARHNDGTANPCCACGEGEYFVSLNGETACLTAFSEDTSIGEFYAYNASTDDSGTAAPIPEDGASTLALFEDGAGDLHLVVVHEHPDSADGGAADFTFTGLGSAGWTAQDDPTDTYPSASEARWAWASAHTDGGAVGPLAAGFDVSIDMTFNREATRDGRFDDGLVDRVRFVNADGSEALSASLAASGDGASALARVSSTCPVAATPRRT